MLAEENKNPGPSALDGKKVLFTVYVVHIVFLLHSHCFTLCSTFKLVNVLYNSYSGICHESTVCAAYLSVILGSIYISFKIQSKEEQVFSVKLHFDLVSLRW